MSALLDRLRELARADNPDLGGATTLGDVAEELRQSFPALAVSVDAETDPALPMSLENALIVFGNLLDNSRHHGAGRVVLAPMQEEGRLVVRVHDDGAGVSPGNRERVFDPFFTTRRAEGGAGMGLGIVRALMRAYGGDVRLEDSETGALFAVIFAPEQMTIAPRSFWRGLKEWRPFRKAPATE